MSERIFEQAINTLSVAYMAGWALVAICAFQKKSGLLPTESRKPLERALAFIKKANSAEETLKQTHLNLASLESFEAYTIAFKSVHSGGDKNLLKGRDFGVFLKTIEDTIETLLNDGNVSPNNIEDTRVFFSHLMHFASSKKGNI